MSHIEQIQRYFYIENLGLNPDQLDILKDWFKDFNNNRCPYPNLDTQVKVRPDGDAVIFRALVNRDFLDRSHIVDKLADIFEVDPGTITVVTLSSPYGEGVDLERPAGTKRLRFGVFAGRDTSLEESRASCISYLADNATAWGEGGP